MRKTPPCRKEGRAGSLTPEENSSKNTVTKKRLGPLYSHRFPPAFTFLQKFLKNFSKGKSGGWLDWSRERMVNDAISGFVTGNLEGVFPERIFGYRKGGRQFWGAGTPKTKKGKRVQPGKSKFT
jgi:hypothetical protein